MKKVTIVQSRLTHYRVSFYELLRDALSARDIELVLYVGTATSADRAKHDEGSIEWARTIRNRHLRLPGMELLWQPCLAGLRGSDVVVVTQENRLLLNYLLLLAQRVGGPKVAVWGHGRNFQSPRPKGVREAWKRLWVRSASWWFAYTEATRKLLLDTGFPDSRITVVNNAVDTRELRRLRSTVQPGELSALRDDLRIEGAAVGVFCGALYAEKRISFLLEAARRVRSLVTNFELLVIGAGPDAHLVAAAARENSWIRYVGPKFDKDKVAHMMLGHVLVMPGLVGLAILDGFALGLPLLTTDCRLHSPEIHYLTNGRNGYMTADSVEAYADAVGSVLRDRPRLETLRNNCIMDAESHSIEEMVQRFVGGIESCLS